MFSPPPWNQPQYTRAKCSHHHPGTSLNIRGLTACRSYIDSTCLHVCHIRRARANKVFKHLAAKGMISVGWFYGFKLHLVINERGELLNMTLTPGNTDDRKPVIQLLKGLRGKVFGDRGYIGQALGRDLREQFGIALITKLRRNMKKLLMLMDDKLWLRKRGLIETVNAQLKNIAQIEHTRHRSPINFLVNLLSGLISYCHQFKKPSVATNA
jgi:Transposase DDE domain